MTDIDYGAYGDFYDKIISEYAGGLPKKAVDLGCGTGSVTVELAKRGYETVGIDTSFEMLSAAEKKTEDMGLSVIYTEQDMRFFGAGGGFGAAICAFDGINYLITPDGLSLCARCVYDELSPGGLFIFDINTPYKFEHTLSDNSFVYELDDLFLVWRSFYMKKRSLCDYYLTFFEKENKSWIRADEYQRQRVYTDRKINGVMTDAGFELIEKWSDTSFSPVTDKSERVFYVWKKTQVK